MTQDEKRIKIAEACGWKRLTGEPQDMLWPCNSYVTGKDGIIMKKPGVTHRHGVSPPDYFNDLNACHEMEEFISSSLRLRYTLNLTDITDDFFWSKARATAAQRAEAFGLTLNLW